MPICQFLLYCQTNTDFNLFSLFQDSTTMFSNIKTIFDEMKNKIKRPESS
jgi:hypothetical protein